MEKSRLPASAMAKPAPKGPRPRSKPRLIIQPEFSGLRAIPLDPFDAAPVPLLLSLSLSLWPSSSSSSSSSSSFLPYFVARVRFATRCKFAPIAPKPVGNIKPVATRIATQSKPLHFPPRALSPPVASHLAVFPPTERKWKGKGIRAFGPDNAAPRGGSSSDLAARNH